MNKYAITKSEQVGSKIKITGTVDSTKVTVSVSSRRYQQILKKKGQAAANAFLAKAMKAQANPTAPVAVETFEA